ncbi:MAG: hypothetical protein U5K00_08030 [Melioribacteraceae bacterium]|nr:hypothetical protein [Melioribacteraceae bacterium]
MTYTLLHGLIMQAIFLGTDISKVYYRLVLNVTNKTGLAENIVLIALLSVPFVHLTFRSAFGVSSVFLSADKYKV